LLEKLSLTRSQDAFATYRPKFNPNTKAMNLPFGSRRLGKAHHWLQQSHVSDGTA
jgi:hypothetical protein